MQANNSISVTANLGLVDLPSNATTNYRYYILPEVQTITANQNDTTTVMLSVLVNQYGSDFSGFKLVDETGADINYQLVGSQQFATNSVNTYRVTIPAGKTLQHVRASSNKCNLEGKQYNKALTCSNDAEINLVKLGHGILSVEPSMFNMSESYASQVIKLTNTGSGNVSSINYPAFDVPFSVSNNNCESVSRLAPQQSCTMTINYESTNSTSGQITPVFSYDDDNDVSTDPKNTEIVIPYIGKTTTSFSVLEVSPYSASLTAENSRKVFTITNLAGGNTSGVTISSWTLPTLPAPLELESTNCYAIGANGPAPSPTTKPLNVGDSCVYTIKYSSAESAGESSLAFNYNNGIDEQITNVAIDWVIYRPISFEQYAYITNYGQNMVTKCVINNTGSLTSCEDSGASGLDGPVGIAVRNTGTSVYIVNSNNNLVIRCQVDSDNNLTDCGDSGATGLNLPTGIAFGSSGSYVYITNNGTNSVVKCSVTSNGFFDECADANVADLDSPWSIALSRTQNFVYITNISGVIFRCDVDPADGTLSGCTSMPTYISQLVAIALNSSGTEAYTAHIAPQNIVQSCTINGADFENCPSITDLDSPIAIAINYSKPFGYIANFSSSSILKCAIDEDEKMRDCVDSGIVINEPHGIAIWSPPE